MARAAFLPLAALLAARPASAATSSMTVTLDANVVDNTVHLFDEELFGFNAGGTATVNATCSGPLEFPVTFVILTADQAEPLYTDGHTACDLAFRYVRAVDARTRLSLNYTATFGGDLRTGFYRFAMLLCAATDFPPAVECRASLTLLNPGGEHLSSDQIALPAIYQKLLIFWVVVILAHTVNWLVFFRFRNNLHDMTVVAPILAAICVRLRRDAWIARSDNDTSHSDALIKESLVAEYATLCFCFFMLMLISYGYYILRSNFEPNRGKSMAMTASACFLSMVCMVYVHRYFLALTVICLVMIIVTILKNSGKNSILLRVRLLEIEALTETQLDSPDEFAAPLLAKRFMITAGRFIFITYSVLWSIEGVVDGAMKQHRDTQLLLEEVLMIFLVVSIMWVVRLRNFTKFVQPHTQRRREREAEANEARRPPCEIMELPGDKRCLGIKISAVQFHTFLDGLRRISHDAGPPASPPPIPPD